MSWQSNMKNTPLISKFRNTDGFTLLEMMVVLIIIGLSAALATTQFSLSARELTAFEFAQIMKSNLVRERLDAIARREVNNVTFYLHSEKSIIIGNVTSEKIPDHFEITLLTGQELQKASKVAAIQFFPDGTSIGGEIFVRAKAGTTAKLNVSWLTGLSSIIKLDGLQ